MTRPRSTTPSLRSSWAHTGMPRNRNRHDVINSFFMFRLTLCISQNGAPRVNWNTRVSSPGFLIRGQAQLKRKAPTGVSQMAERP